jgi:hypothetical protein
MRNVAIVGTRPPTASRAKVAILWAEYDAIVADVASWVSKFAGSEWRIVSGGADGVDHHAVACFARYFATEPLVLLPLYEIHGKRAPLVRNQQIVDAADEIHAWPSSWSRGTWDTYRRAVNAGKLAVLHEPFKEKR